MTAQTIRHAIKQPIWPEPQPLPEGLPPVPILDPLLLPDAMRPWLMDIADRMQCPLDFPSVGALVSLSAIVGRQIGIRPKQADDWTVVPNLWGAIVGRPGVLKTPSLQEAMKPVQRQEAKAREEYEIAQREESINQLVREVEKTVAKKRIKNAINQGSDPTLVAAMLADDDPKVNRKRFLTQDPTVEKLGELLAANPNGMLVFRDELSGWLRALDRDGQECARAFYLEAWAGTGSYTYDRIGRGTIDIEAACVSVLGGIQPGPLMEYLRGALHGGGGDDGLLQRLQIVVWPDIPKTWIDVDRRPDAEARAGAWAVYDRLAAIVPDALGATRDDGIPYLRPDPAALAAYQEWRARLEHRLRTGDDHPAFEAHLAKYRSLVPSIALLVHLVDAPAGGPVTESAMLTAIGWAGYLEAHARRLYAHALDPALAAARELDKRIQKGEIVSPFRARDIHRKGWRLLDRAGVTAALEYLHDLDRVRPITSDTGGRPTVEWHINPTIGGGA